MEHHRLSFDEYDTAVRQGIVSEMAMFDWNTNKLFKTSKSFAYKGTNYLVCGGCISEWFEAYAMVPVSMYTGEVFESPAYHVLGYYDNSYTTEKGTYRERGSLEGLHILFNRRDFVLTGKVKFIRDLPYTAFLTPRNEVVGYHELNKDCGWRSTYFEDHEPDYSEISGLHVAKYECERITIYTVIYSKPNGDLDEVTFKSLDELHAQLDHVPNNRIPSLQVQDSLF